MLSYLRLPRDLRHLTAAPIYPLTILAQNPVPQTGSATSEIAGQLGLDRKMILSFSAVGGQPLNKTKGKPVFPPSGNWLCQPSS